MSTIHKGAFSATKILLPVDFSPSSEAAFEAATGLARQFHAGIHLVHVIAETPDFNGSDFFPETAVLEERKETIEEKLAARKEQLTLEGVPTSFSIEEGNDIVGSLIRVIKRENADMVVISTHGLAGWRPLILGSIAAHLIKQVDCTLLLLKPVQHVSAIEQSPIEVAAGSVVPHGVETVHTRSHASETETLAEERLDRSAEEMAERGGRTERQYDQAHSLITK